MSIFENQLIVIHIAKYAHGRAWFSLYMVSKNIRKILQLNDINFYNKYGIDNNPINNYYFKILEQRYVELVNEGMTGLPYPKTHILANYYQPLLQKGKKYDKNSPKLPKIGDQSTIFTLNKYAQVTHKMKERIEESWVLCPLCYSRIKDKVINIRNHLDKCPRYPLMQLSCGNRCEIFHDSHSCPVQRNFRPVKCSSCKKIMVFYQLKLKKHLKHCSYQGLYTKYDYNAKITTLKTTAYFV